ncbi:hypothetical protein GCM10009633_08130 [Janibacter melonis]
MTAWRIFAELFGFAAPWAGEAAKLETASAAVAAAAVTAACRADLTMIYLSVGRPGHADRSWLGR